MVCQSHRKFKLDVTDGSNAPQQHCRFDLFCKSHGQPLEATDVDVGKIGHHFTHQVDPFVRSEQRLFVRVDANAHGQSIEQARPSLNDVQMTESRRVETANVNRVSSAGFGHSFTVFFECEWAVGRMTFENSTG